MSASVRGTSMRSARGPPRTPPLLDNSGSGFATLFLDRTGVTTTSTSVSGLGNQTLYYWRVSATNAGGSSAFSAARSFTMICTNGNCQN